MSAYACGRRCLLLAFFAYVALDLGCPLMPGAFSFDPAGSVEAVSAYRVPSFSAPRIAAQPFVMTAARTIPRPTNAPVCASAPAPLRWRAHAAVGSLSSVEDH